MMLTDLDHQILKTIYEGDLPGLTELLARHPDVIHRESGAGTWLHVAARRPSLEIAKYLLEMGCDVNACQEDPHEEPLENAIEQDHPAMVRLLLEHGANPDSERGRYCITAVTGSKVNGLETIQLLEQYGADILRVCFHRTAKKNINALSEAIGWGKHDVVEYLKSRGAVLPDQPPPKNGESRSAP